MNKIEKHIPYKYKLLSLFGGIGADRKALIRLFGFYSIKSVDYVDVLNWAVEAYNKMYQNNHLPQSVTEWNLDVDILVHGSPCQDFSLAGKMKGGVKGSNTRSSLLWETIDIIKNRLNKLPKIILWENVKAVTTPKHKGTFEKYLKELEKLGYVNKWKVLNATNFGIPQKRERLFVVSVLKSEEQFLHFDFDNLIKKETPPLSHFLENDVDITYYLNNDSLSKPILDKRMEIKNNIVKVSNSKVWKSTNKINTVFKRLKKESDDDLKLNNFDDYGKITIPFSDHFASNHVWNTNTTIPTIQTSPNNLKVIEKLQKVDVETNDTFEIENSFYKTKVDENSNQLPIFLIDNIPYYVRLLTERECWRLMGYDDTDYDKISYLPKRAKYFLAGNSIVVNVLEAIFSELLLPETQG